MGDAVKFFAIVALGALVIGALLSQRGKAPGLTNGRLKPPGAKPNAVCSEDDTPSTDHVDPLQGTLAEVRQAIEATGGTITTETDDYIAATYASKLFRFVDDVEVRDAGKGTVHIRSASRVGYSDMGANRKRVERIRSALRDIQGDG